MVYVNNDSSQSFLSVNKYDDDIPKDHISRLIKKMVKNDFKYLDDENEKSRGRAAYRKTSLLAIVLYAYYDNHTSCREMEDLSMFHLVYKYLGDGIKPNERTFQRFIKDNKETVSKVLKRTVKLAEEKGFTKFNHIAIDGTIIKANNSNYNIIKAKEIDKLIKIIRKQYDTETILEKGYKLSKSAYRFLTNPKLTDNDKIKKLQELKKELKKSGQKSIGINDTDARWMLNKKGQTEISFNMQSAVDYESKMIVSVDINNKPTDHTQLEKQIENVENTIEETPQVISADNGYHTNENINSIQNKDIDLLIPTRKQNKQHNHKLNPNPFHKDHFKYNFETDTYTCPEGKELYYQNSYKIKNTKKGQPNKIKRVYYNKDCYQCPLKDLCTKSEVRIITEYENELAKIIEQRMETPEAQEEYKKRSHTVEPPFGVLKQQKQLNTVHVTGQEEVKNRITLKAIGYNLKRLENMIKNNVEESNSLKNFANNLHRENPDIKFSFIIQ